MVIAHQKSECAGGRMALRQQIPLALRLVGPRKLSRFRIVHRPGRRQLFRFKVDAMK